MGSAHRVPEEERPMRSSTLTPRSGFALLCAALGWLGSATDARAGLLINVDFNARSPTYSGAGVLGASGDVWNGIGGGPGVRNVPLVDSANAATGVTLSHRLFNSADAA